MRVKIDKKVLSCFCIILPFFQLNTIDLLIEKGVMTTVLSLLDFLFAISRCGIVSLAILNAIKHKRHIGTMTKVISLFCLVRTLASVINGSFYMNIIITDFYYIGFGLAIERLMKIDDIMFIRGCEFLFGLLSWSAILTSILFPNGYFNAATKDAAIYFLGSKNAGFYYYTLYIFFMILYSFYHNGRVEIKTYVFIGCSIIAAIINASANTLICMLILMGYCIAERILSHTDKVIEPWKIIIVITILGWIFVAGKNVPIVNRILTFLGRGNNYTGRDYIWKLYIMAFSTSPIWGVGSDYQVIMENGLDYAIHAHNFYLDCLCKFGIVSFIFLLVMIICVGQKVSLKKNKHLKLLYTFILLVILLHSLMDDITIYMLILTFVTMENIGDKKQQIRFIAKMKRKYVTST